MAGPSEGLDGRSKHLEAVRARSTPATQRLYGLADAIWGFESAPLGSRSKFGAAAHWYVEPRLKPIRESIHGTHLVPVALVSEPNRVHVSSFTWMQAHGSVLLPAQVRQDPGMGSAAADYEMVLAFKTLPRWWEGDRLLAGASASHPRRAAPDPAFTVLYPRYTSA
jgi:hypothetical protein